MSEAVSVTKASAFGSVSELAVRRINVDHGPCLGLLHGPDLVRGREDQRSVHWEIRDNHWGAVQAYRCYRGAVRCTPVLRGWCVHPDAPDHLCCALSDEARGGPSLDCPGRIAVPDVIASRPAHETHGDVRWPQLEDARD